MCGIFGVYASALTGESRREVTRRALHALRHRGPDSSGEWHHPEVPLSLGHTRLAILDLSALGAQPMHSESGRLTTAFNGEIYNFHDLKARLEPAGHRFKGGSDTEVLLAAAESWGWQRAAIAFNGMFAAATWHEADRTLTLVRDRIGKKPLYYGWRNGLFVCASELKAFVGIPGFSLEIDHGAVAYLMRYGYIPAPSTIYRDVYKLLPGSILTLSQADLTAKPAGFDPFGRAGAGPQKYWDLFAVEQEARTQRSGSGALSLDAAVEELSVLLEDSIRLRLIADVPVGAFLSGGIDSSTVVALMQRIAPGKVKTFSIGFTHGDFDESRYAAAIAKHLGTDHTELMVSPQEALDVIPHLPTIFDEPFADSSLVPTYLVSKLARAEVTVSLSGDGGDELFAGYQRYEWGNRIWRMLKSFPLPLRRTAAALAPSVPSWAFQNCFRLIERFLPGSNGRLNSLPSKIERAATLVRAASDCDLYRSMNTHWYGSHGRPVWGNGLPVSFFSETVEMPRGVGGKDLFSFVDLLTYLPDDILTKVDRASMAVSLEARVPLLDYRIIEFSRRIPASVKAQGAVGKLPLRRLLRQFVPDELFDRPKMGFSMPVGVWLRAELRSWAEELLGEALLNDTGVFDTAVVRSVWSDHLNDLYDGSYLLWDVLMFQAWWVHQKESLSAHRLDSYPAAAASDQSAV